MYFQVRNRTYSAPPNVKWSLKILYLISIPLGNISSVSAYFVNVFENSSLADYLKLLTEGNTIKKKKENWLQRKITNIVKDVGFQEDDKSDAGEPLNQLLT